MSERDRDKEGDRENNNYVSCFNIGKSMHNHKHHTSACQYILM